MPAIRERNGYTWLPLWPLHMSDDDIHKLSCQYFDLPREAVSWILGLGAYYARRRDEYNATGWLALSHERVLGEVIALFNFLAFSSATSHGKLSDFNQRLVEYFMNAADLAIENGVRLVD